MKSPFCSALGVATLAFFTAGVFAQAVSTDSLIDLLDSQKNLSSFASYIRQYPDILSDLPSDGGITVLAPDDDAFVKIPFGALNKAFDRNDTNAIINALRYHIIKGTHKAADLVPGTSYNFPTLMKSNNYTNVTGGQRVTNIKQAQDVVVYVSGLGTRSEIKQGDLEFDGGVVQIISSPIIPPPDLSTTAIAYNLTSFDGALYTCNKVDNLSSLKDITIFAPSNGAFMALGSAVTDMTVGELSKVLDYHIIHNRVLYSSDITNGTEITTYNNRSISVQQIGNKLFLNSAQLITKDVLMANGVIHVLDNVLNPKYDGPAPNPEIATQLPAFSNATSVTYIPFTTALPCSTDCTTSSSGGVTNEGISQTGTATSASGSAFRTSSSVAAAAIARETGFGAAGMLAAVGGAMLMI